MNMQKVLIEISERLGAIEAALKSDKEIQNLKFIAIDKSLAEHHKVLHGNGSPGLIKEFEQVKLKLALIVAVITFVVNVGVNIGTRYLVH